MVQHYEHMVYLCIVKVVLYFFFSTVDLCEFA